MSSFGGAPFINSSWNEESFSVNELFEKETGSSFYFFLNQLINRCPHPQKNSQEIVCLQSSDPTLFSDALIENIVFMFKQINVTANLTISTAQKFNVYIQKQVNRILLI